MRYIREINYYETDQMKIVHHSNYIRYFEEARLFFLKVIDFPYDLIEEKGFLSPVLEINCKYLYPTKFGDTIEIKVDVITIKQSKFILQYKTYKDNILINQATTTHCFVDKEMNLVSIKKQYPELYNKLLDLYNNNYLD